MTTCDKRMQSFESRLLNVAIIGYLTFLIFRFLLFPPSILTSGQRRRADTGGTRPAALLVKAPGAADEKEIFIFVQSVNYTSQVYSMNEKVEIKCFANLQGVLFERNLMIFVSITRWTL